MLKVTYFYSACIGIRSPEVSVLCDPWFTEGAYDGSWYQFPVLQNPIEKMGPYDLIYVSHIHPDHYDPTFLKKYLTAYPQTKVVIAPFQQNFLLHKMKADGIHAEIGGLFTFGETQVHLIPNESIPEDIDSALIVKRGDHSVVNLNDNLFDVALVEKIKKIVAHPTIAFLGYTGAGPYPQTYFPIGEELIRKAQQKKEQFFVRYQKMAAAIDAKVNIPFAGKYVLGGALTHLNPYRGVSDAVEVLRLDPKAIVLSDGGEASIDTDHLNPTSVRTEKYSDQALAQRYREIESAPMLYDTYFHELPASSIPFKRLLGKAYKTASARSLTPQDYFFCIKLPQEWFVMNAKRDSDFIRFVKCEPGATHSFNPRSEIELDAHYLFGLLTCVFHWNNAEVGSQFTTRRIPDDFNRTAQSFLNFFHV